jgi:SAM-dependent methyltransferase
MFDIVVASQSIEHVPDESSILTEIGRVLKPNGFFIMGVPSNGHSYNPLHFREYTKHDIKRLELILEARCLGYKAYGGRLFLEIYGCLNKVAGNSMGMPVKETLESRIERIKKELPPFLKIARYIYHKVFVKLLIIFYLIDGKFHKNKNYDIWFVFKLNSF